MLRRKGHLLAKFAFVILLALPAYVLLLNKAPSVHTGEPGVQGGDYVGVNPHGGDRDSQRDPDNQPPKSQHSSRLTRQHSPNDPHNFDPKQLAQQRRRSLEDREADTPKAPAQASQHIIEASGIRGRCQSFFSRYFGTN